MGTFCSVIIPVRFDDRVYRTVILIERLLDQNDISHEIIVSGKLDCPEKLPEYATFISESGRKGENILSGLRASSGEYVVVIDADLPVKASELLSLIMSADAFDVILPRRSYSFSLKDKDFLVDLFRSFRTWLFRMVVAAFLPSIRMFDCQFGVKCFKASLLRGIVKNGIRLQSLAFDMELLLKLIDKGFRIDCPNMKYVHDSRSVIKSIPAGMELLLGAIFLACQSTALFDLLLTMRFTRRYGHYRSLRSGER